MPILYGKYKNPGWENNTTPAIDEDELNALSDTVESLDAERGTSPVLKGDVEIQGQGQDSKIELTTNLGPRAITVLPDTDSGEITLSYDDGNVDNSPVTVHGVNTPTDANDAVNKQYADTKATKSNPTFTGTAAVAGSLIISPDSAEEGVAFTGGYDRDNTPFVEVLGTFSDELVLLRGLTTPKTNTDAANKAYVDNVKAGIKAVLSQIALMMEDSAWSNSNARSEIQDIVQLIDQL